MKLTDEQIDDIFDGWSDAVEYIDESGDEFVEDRLTREDFRAAVEDILSAAIPEGCGVWREEECGVCNGTTDWGNCGDCRDGVVPVERVGK